MTAILSPIIDLVLDVLWGPELWPLLAIAVVITTATLTGLTARIVVWLHGRKLALGTESSAASHRLIV